MSHVERLEMEGNPLGLVAVILALTLILALIAAVTPWLRDQHRAGLARARADNGGRLRLADRYRWAITRPEGKDTSWAQQLDE